MKKRTVGVLLFPGFELLDVFGPLEAFGVRPSREHFEALLIAERAGEVASTPGQRAIADVGFDDPRPLDVLLVPGGMGTRREVDNPRLLGWITERARGAEIVASVCTGAGLLARAGVLDGRRATSNKLAFAWAREQGPKTEWVKEARWVEDGNVFTSAGVSAGIDMALAIIARAVSPELAEQAATFMEYDWHRDSGWDPFARVHGLV